MTEAGQIFALLRSTSAAEIAKRFNMPSDNPPLPVPTPDTAGTPSGGTGGAGQTAGKPGGTQGALAAALANLGGAGAGPPEAGPADPLHPAQTGTNRAMVSLGHLSPPRADIVRVLADSLMSGLSKMGGTVTSGAVSIPAQGGVTGQGPQPGLGGGTSIPPQILSSGLAGAVDIDLASSTGQLASGTGGAEAGSGAGMATTFAGDGAARSIAASTATGTTGATGVGAAETAETNAEATQTAQGSSTTGTRGAVAGPGVPVQVAAFAEAMAAMLDPGASGKAGTVASGIIFNAAMIPGWPFPSAMARDGAEGVNTKALLHRLATAMEGMTPQQAAEYMAKIGGGHVLLRNLRKILKELDMTTKDEVKGLLMAFLETISTIAAGLQTAMKQMSESAALQAAVVHGEDPEDGDRPGRRRLRL